MMSSHPEDYGPLSPHTLDKQPSLEDLDIQWTYRKITAAEAEALWLVAAEPLTQDSQQQLAEIRDHIDRLYGRLSAIAHFDDIPLTPDDIPITPVELYTEERYLVFKPMYDALRRWKPFGPHPVKRR